MAKIEDANLFVKVVFSLIVAIFTHCLYLTFFTYIHGIAVSGQGVVLSSLTISHAYGRVF